METRLRLQWNSGRSKRRIQMRFCCFQFYVAFLFEDLLLSGNFWDNNETFTLSTAIGLNMTHNASFYAKSANAGAWNRARLVEAKLSCFCCCINALVKSTRLESFQRDHGKRVPFTSETSIWRYWSVLFD